MKRFLFILVCSFATHFVLGQQEEQVSFQSGPLTLNGTFTIPEGNGPFPVVVLVHGSGPNDRDQTTHLTGGNAQCLYPGLVNKTVKNFRDIAEAFQARGIAALRYDKRTYSHASQLDPKEISPYDFIADVHAAVDYIKAREEVDTSKLILLGHSQGANLIPMVAKERNDIAALLSLGTGATGIDTLYAMQVRQLYYQCLMDTVTGDSAYTDLLDGFGQIRNRSWPANTPYQNAYPKFWKHWMNITDSAIINYNRISHPTLFLHAEKDFNIPVEDAQRYEAQLVRDSFDLYYMDGLTHFFSTLTDPQVPGAVPDTICSWLAQYNLDSSSVGGASFVNKLLHPKPPVKVYYRPGRIILQSNANQPIRNVHLIDMLGNVVAKPEINSPGRIEIKTGHRPEGMYLLVATIGDSRFVEKVFLSR